MNRAARRFWPSLYDRLIAEDFSGVRSDHCVDLDTLRAHIMRDLQQLLNTTALEPETGQPEDEDRFARLRRSVVNYGVPDLPGKIVTGVSEIKLRDHLRAALRRFEPRIAADSVRVMVDTGDMHSDPHANIRIDPERGVSLAITGEVRGLTEADLLNVRIETRIDVAHGETQVSIV